MIHLFTGFLCLSSICFLQPSSFFLSELVYAGDDGAEQGPGMPMELPMRLWLETIAVQRSCHGKLKKSQYWLKNFMPKLPKRFSISRILVRVAAN